MVTMQWKIRKTWKSYVLVFLYGRLCRNNMRKYECCSNPALCQYGPYISVTDVVNVGAQYSGSSTKSRLNDDPQPAPLSLQPTINTGPFKKNPAHCKLNSQVTLQVAHHTSLFWWVTHFQIALKLYSPSYGGSPGPRYTFSGLLTASLP